MAKHRSFKLEKFVKGVNNDLLKAYFIRQNVPVPDGFVFVGPMNPAFKQIGNAVPPLMSKSIAELMMRELKRGPTNVEEISS